MIVNNREQRAGHRTIIKVYLGQSQNYVNDRDGVLQLSENVTRRGTVLSSLKTCTKLTNGQQEVHVIGPDEILNDKFKLQFPKTTQQPRTCAKLIIVPINDCSPWW